MPHWLALVALLVQLVASFGHIHAEDYRFLLRGHGAPTLSAADAAGGRSSPLLPGDADCAICASVQLLGGSALPPPFVAPAPQIVPIARVVAFAEIVPGLPLHFLFLTRAPPSAPTSQD